MDKTYDIQFEDGVTRVQFNEIAEINMLENAIREALELDDQGLRLWVFSKGTNITTEELRRLARLSDNLQRIPARSAFVAADDLTFGLGRMHEAYRDAQTHASRVFRSEAEALAWLKGSSDGEADGK